MLSEKELNKLEEIKKMLDIVAYYLWPEKIKTKIRRVK